MYHKNILVAI